MREIRRATTVRELRQLNLRARAFALQYLTHAGSLDWLAPAVSLTDVSIVKRIIAMAGNERPSVCWCFCGASGRGESLTKHAPQLVLIVDGEDGRQELLQQYERVSDALSECDYLARTDMTYDRPFHVASTGEWRTRYENWLRDPVRSEMYRARPLFDLRPVHGLTSLWREVEASVVATVDRDFLTDLAGRVRGQFLEDVENGLRLVLGL